MGNGQASLKQGAEHVRIRQRYDGKHVVYYSKGKDERTVTALGAFYRCFLSAPSHVGEFMSGKYYAGELVRELLRGAKENDQEQHVRTIKAAGILDEKMATAILAHGRIGNETAMVLLWDEIKRDQLQKVVLWNARLPHSLVDDHIRKDVNSFLKCYAQLSDVQRAPNGMGVAASLARIAISEEMQNIDVNNLPKLVFALYWTEKVYITSEDRHAARLEKTMKIADQARFDMVPDETIRAVFGRMKPLSAEARMRACESVGASAKIGKIALDVLF
jgi:hypothetical protein